MLITNAIGVPRGAQMNGLGAWWMAALELLGTKQGGNGQAVGVQPAIVQNAPSSDTGLYLGLGVGLLAVTGLAVTLLRSPARAKSVAGYRRRSRRSRK